MKKNCIVLQGHVPDLDIQGGLNYLEKIKAFDLSIEHIIKFNPSSYIIICGHGYRPNNLYLANFVNWRDESYPLDENGYVANQPAQFISVSQGIEHALQQGFEYCLKTRLDSLLGQKNIVEWCHDILIQEDKKILLTQQTSEGRVGDIVMYGKTSELYDIWKETNPVVSNDGLLNTAANFKKTFGVDVTLENLRKIAAFRDVTSFPMMCLRYNYHQVKDKINEIMDPDSGFNYNQYHWGKGPRYHWLENGVLKSYDASWNEQVFYG